MKTLIAALTVLVLCGCATGASSMDIEDDAGSPVLTACFDLEDSCTTDDQCCQTSGIAACVATYDLAPTCMLLCVADQDCCSPGYTCRTCHPIVGMNYGVCD